MTEMLLTSPEVKKTLLDYDIVFDSGLLPITLDPAAGDRIELTPTVIQIHIEPKPSLSDPKTNIPGEDMTIFVNKVVSITKRQREVTALTPEERDEWSRVMTELSKTIQ